MCGIAGIARASRAPVERETLERMCEAQVHRGPDARGLHLAEGVGLGIQRLRVIDLVTGDQPIHNEDRTVTVVLNGEIYNFRELRRRLRRERPPPRDRRRHRGDRPPLRGARAGRACASCTGCSRSRCGTAAAASCCWRATASARSRCSTASGTARSASPRSCAALMQDPEVPREIDHRALDAYLAYGYVPAPLSAFAAVRKLMPASTLIYRDGRIRDRALLAPGLLAQASPSGRREELHEEIRDTIRRGRAAAGWSPTCRWARSSRAASTPRRSSRRWPRARAEPVKTFSIGFEDERFNELPQARLVAQRVRAPTTTS